MITCREDVSSSSLWERGIGVPANLRAVVNYILLKKPPTAFDFGQLSLVYNAFLLISKLVEQIVEQIILISFWFLD